MGTTQTPSRSRVTCPTDHKHNSNCYRRHHCGCDTCRNSIVQQSRDYRRKKAYNQPTTTLVPADPIREHVNQLRAAGMGQKRIADLAGIPPHVIRSLLHNFSGHPPVSRLQAASAKAILAVQPDPRLLLRRDPRGTRRRIQALSARGWTLSAMSRLLGMPVQGVHALLSVRWVTPETFERVRVLYEQLWDQEPPQGTPAERKAAAYAKTVARKHGWVPPLAWDDIDWDDRPPQVHGVNRQLMTVRERATRVVELHRLRLSDHHIAVSLGIADRTVLRIRQRLGLPGWTKEQQEAAA